MSITPSGLKEERGPFAALLIALVIFLGLVPLVDALGGSQRIVRIGLTSVMIVGLGVAWKDRGVLGAAFLLLVPNLIAQWLASTITGDESLQELLRHALAAGYLFYLVAVLSRILLLHKEACLDSVLGGINVYLVLALAFMELHTLAEHINPGSYVSAGVALSDPASHIHGSLATTMLYFSFTTLTTLGYGDIAPVKPIAQFICSAEAVVGQLFVAILIGGLVALWVGGMRSDSSESQPPKESS